MDYRDEIKKMTKTIPRSVIEGGVMQAGLWKERAAKALKIANSSASTKNELIRAFQEMQQFK